MECSAGVFLSCPLNRRNWAKATWAEALGSEATWRGNWSRPAIADTEKGGDTAEDWNRAGARTRGTRGGGGFSHAPTWAPTMFQALRWALSFLPICTWEASSSRGDSHPRTFLNTPPFPMHPHISRWGDTDHRPKGLDSSRSTCSRQGRCVEGRPAGTPGRRLPRRSRVLSSCTRGPSPTSPGPARTPHPAPRSAPTAHPRAWSRRARWARRTWAGRRPRRSHWRPSAESQPRRSPLPRWGGSLRRLPKITIRAQEVWPALRGRAAEAPYSRGLRGLRGVSPATLLHLPPPPPPTQAAAAPGRVWPTRGPGRRRALTVRPQRRGAGGRPQRQRQGPGDRPAEVHRAAARSPAASAAPRAAGRVEPRESPAPRRGVGRSPAPPRRPWG